MAVTRKDVARLAQVSEATVSYVMNNTKNVTPAVRERVLAAIKELNYHPNLLAKSLATNETRHVIMLVDNLKNPHYGNLMQGAQSAAEKEGYLVSVLSSKYCSRRTMEELVSRGIDGVIMTLSCKDSDFITDLNIPVYSWDDNLRLDYHQAIQDMTSAFQKLGHKNIAFLSGLPLSIGDPRYFSFQESLRKYDLNQDPALIVDGDGCTDERAGYAAADELLKRKVPFTGVFAINDLMAIGAMKCFWDKGLHVPEDISICGCDAIESASYTLPPLATINSNSFQLGEGLMYRMVSMLHPEWDLPQKNIVDPASFVQRASMGQAPE